MEGAPHNLTPQIAERVLEQGEIRLAAQLQIALAADRRAITAAAILIAVSAALFGFAGDEFRNTTADMPLVVGATVMGALLLFSAVICVLVAKPIQFDLAGADPENWWSDGVTNRAYEHCLWRESTNYSDRIKRNKAILGRNAKRFRRAMFLACSSPVIGAASWLIVSRCQ